MFGLPGEIVIFICWVGLFLIFTGIGLLIRCAWGLKLYDAETLLLSFWSGWAISIGVLQFWHFWWKIDGWAFLLVSVVGVIGLIWNAPHLRQVITTVIRKQWFPLLLMVIVGLWLANRSTAWAIRPEYDTGLYHLTSVKWAASYPVVPGLGNLHGRLAFNSGFFLYAAMLDVGPWNEKSLYLANGLLMYVLLLQLLMSVFKLSQRDSYRTYHFYQSLLLVPVIPGAFGVNWVFGLSPANLSPDVSVFLMGIVLSGRVLTFLLGLEHSSDERRRSYDLLYIIVMAVLGTIIKLNFVFLAGPLLLLVLTAWLAQDRGQLKRKAINFVLLSGGCTVALFVPWVVRNVILSGYLVFPDTITAVPVAWQIPRALVISEANFIRSWGRQTYALWSDTLGNTAWLQPWLNEVPEYITMPLELTLLALLGIGFYRRRTDALQQHRSPIPWGVLLPPMVAIVLWFVSAPNPRFVGASFWILAAGTIALVTERMIRIYQIEHLSPVLNYLVFAGVFLYISPIRNPLWIAPVEQNKDGLATVPVPGYEVRETASGLNVYIPLQLENCSNVPLPCTPYFRPGLRLREAGNMRKGFVLDRQQQFVDMRISAVPQGLTASPDIGVALQRGWHGYDAVANLLWMETPAKLLLYTEQDVTVKLALTPDQMNVGNAFGGTGQLTITINNEHAMTIPMVTGVTSSVMLPLRRDFNIVQLELVAGNFVPAEVIPGNNDTRSVSIAFSSIQVTLIE